MGGLISSLLPLLLGVILSPLAIVALVAVLVSERARTNGVAYLVGWVVGLGGLMAIFVSVFGASDIHAGHEPPLWATVVRLTLGTVLALWGVVMYRRGREHLRQMKRAQKFGEVVAAAPTLPGYLASVGRFRAGRTFGLGLVLFVLNPVDASCAILAALAIAEAALPSSTSAVVATVFVVLGALPIAIPVFYVLVRGKDARVALDKMRDWIARNTHVLNAGLLLMIGAMQIQSGLSALF